MKKLIITLICAGFLFPVLVFSQDTVNGDWSLQHVILYDTPEADMMVRAGDIDNMGFGWPASFDPFSGNATPSHGYPWTADSVNVMGTDRIMVITSYDGNPPHGQDGYTSYTSRPENLPRPIVLNYSLNGLQVNSAALQIFVDDFQASVWKANYFVQINGQDAPYVAGIINALVQTGPVGKIINIILPENHLYLLESDSLSILFDDITTGAGDGYAIDFVKLLLNPKGFTYTGKISGNVTDNETGLPIENAIVTATGSTPALTDAEGNYELPDVPAGMVWVTVSKFSYDTASVFVDLQAGDEVEKNFTVNEILEAEFSANPLSGQAPLIVNFTDMSSMNPTSWLWDFGDGSTSNEQNPSHTYTADSSYTVSLTASDGTETNTKTKESFIQVGTSAIEKNGQVVDLSVSPNPSSNFMDVSYFLSEPARVQLKLVDQLGQTARTYFDKMMPAGNKTHHLNHNDLHSGIYFLIVKVNEKMGIRKVIITQ